MLPTYNESENIVNLLDTILGIAPDIHIVVADDDSPDRTWELVANYGKKNPNVHLLHRKTNRGRGIAGIEGFQYALQHGADAVVEMDADFSHDPAYIPLFLKLIREFHVVSGSRFVQGGRDAERGWVRRLITYFASLYIRFLLRLKLRDCSSGFRCYSKEVLNGIGLDTMVSTGPSIVQECLLRACGMGFSIIEVPIIFKDRCKGNTKLTYKHLINGFLMVLKLRFSFKAFKERTSLPAPIHEHIS